MGKIEINEIFERPPLHEHCRCSIIALKAIKAGEATTDGENGVDWCVKTFGLLPKNYIAKKEAKILGWIRKKGNLADIAPGKRIGGDIFYNDQQKLPSAPGRIWREADLDYNDLFRSSARILYSNDGLVFVTFSHYETFYEII